MFSVQHGAFDGSKLHKTITDLMLGYRKNYELTFPALNIPPLLVGYLRDLALPRSFQPLPRDEELS